MKTLILILLSFTAIAQSPCTDSAYVALQSTPIDSMTARQYHYYAQKDRECSEYTKDRKQQQEANATVGMWVALSLISTVLIMLPLFAL